MESRGGAIGDYRSPLFFAWQLTNQCAFHCLHCCEDSGPEKGWPDELERRQAFSIARQIVRADIPYAAFGGGEPMGVPFFWEILQILRAGSVEIKIETNGLLIGEEAAQRLRALQIACIQISVDGASPGAHEAVRPEGGFGKALEAIGRLATLGLHAELVFVPTRLNISDLAEAYSLAARSGARAFVTGPLMRLGRAAQSWDSLCVSEQTWRQALQALQERARQNSPAIRLAVYPWDIQEEIHRRAASPQAMMLVVPNGKVKLLNALPFAAADLKQDTLKQAWRKVQQAWRHPSVLEFCRRAAYDPSLLIHANECWELNKERIFKKEAVKNCDF